MSGSYLERACGVWSEGGRERVSIDFTWRGTELGSAQSHTTFDKQYSLKA